MTTNENHYHHPADMFHYRLCDARLLLDRDLPFTANRLDGRRIRNGVSDPWASNEVGPVDQPFLEADPRIILDGQVSQIVKR